MRSLAPLIDACSSRYSFVFPILGPLRLGALDQHVVNAANAGLSDTVMPPRLTVSPVELAGTRPR